ncbi:NAPDH dehydrogenase [Scheffersomyces xylosifermentans]|uniref:NAPDH dehydrogenase n=1 Tax=Scheffersomyces xylosifermentans TaxID=1304137 RepID=UPI00315DE642
MTKANTSLAETNLFKPIVVGDIKLAHRVVFAPTSRARSVNFTPTDIMLEYYTARSKYPGTLIIFESVMGSRTGGLAAFKSGLWSDKQSSALKKITDAIHANGSYVSIQLFSSGRTSSIDLLKKHGQDFAAPSAGLYMSDTQRIKAEENGLELRAFTVDEIHKIQDEFVESSVRALTKANFDYIEIHGGSGHLVEQFLSPLSNQRNDEYGGSVENRSRFLLELVDKLFDHPEIGPSKVSLRLTPFSEHNGMVYPDDIPHNENPTLKACEYIVQELEKRKQEGKEIAYFSLPEPRVSGSSDIDPTGKSNATLIESWTGVLVRAGGYGTNFKGDPTLIKSNVHHLVIEGNEILHYTDLIKHVNEDDRTMIGFSRPFVSNPDLVSRLEKGLKLDHYDRSTFYTHTVDGYLTYGEYNNDEEPSQVKFDEKELQREGIPLE